MILFENTLYYMNLFDDRCKKASERYEEEKKRIKNNYKGMLMDQKLNDAKNEYQAILNDRSSTEQTIRSDFKKIFDELNKILLAQVPADFSATMEMIKATGGMISDYEAETYATKYNGVCFMAVKSITNELQKNGKAESVMVLTGDFVKAELETLLAGCINWLYNWNPNSLSTAFYVSQQYSPILISRSKLEQFFNKEFAVKKDKIIFPTKE